MKLSWRERFLWLCIIASIITGTAWAINELAPFIVTNSSGTPVHVLHTSGIIQNSGARIMNQTGLWSVQNSAVATIAGFHYGGALLYSTDNASTTAIANATAEVTATFAVSEPDTNYYIVGTQSDVSAGITSTIWAKRKAVGSVTFGASNVNSGTAYYTWIKLRKL